MEALYLNSFRMALPAAFPAVLHPHQTLGYRIPAEVFNGNLEQSAEQDWLRNG
jgi:hypothetical protein